MSPFVLAFAVSVLFLNHVKVDTNEADAETTLHGIRIPPGLADARGRPAVDLARQIVDQAGVSGEIGFVRYRRDEQQFVIPISKPGVEAVLTVDAQSNTATISQRKTGVLEAVAYLHKNPGPHNADLRGNWIWMQVWRWIADGTVYLVLFISITGVYLWLTIKADRRTGLAVIGAGMASFVALIYGLVS